jgi:hypothetical protein
MLAAAFSPVSILLSMVSWPDSLHSARLRHVGARSQARLPWLGAF